jgi:rod shape determining protein RodA
MRRALSFRDFDWALLGLMLTLCTISIFEIYSATQNTKFHGFAGKQVYWILGGIVAMFIMSKIDYHRLLDIVWWLYGFSCWRWWRLSFLGTRL